MAFQKGELVEVASKEEGFIGSYFPAKVIAQQRDGSYMVEYATLLEADDESKPLVEKVNLNEVRPRPVHNPATGLQVNDYVDAYDNDGWWVGRIMNIVKGGYSVYFDISMVEVVYPFQRLRKHQEWCYNTWCGLLPFTSETAAHVWDGRSSSSVGCYDVRV